jgi:hypothetical protein
MRLRNYLFIHHDSHCPTPQQPLRELKGFLLAQAGGAGFVREVSPQDQNQLKAVFPTWKVVLPSEDEDETSTKALMKVAISCILKSFLNTTNYSPIDGCAFCQWS